MAENLVGLNITPCKMCMPMGTSVALCGFQNCMTILHGSQGCATYIRRHMATHYNEPVDIASSALTEQGTVFGGESNLVNGLENMIRLYNPDIIGVSTTCLAETIGEDVPGMLYRFRETHPDCRAAIYSIPSPGYGGTHNEGYFAALRAVVEQTEMDPAPNDYIAVFTPQISPADTRWLKKLFVNMGLKGIFVPDLSDNLDGGHEKTYSRLKSGGTTLEQLKMLAGVRGAIELSCFISDSLSPAAVLKERYGVPVVRLPLPVGLRDTDAFLSALESLGGKRTEEMRRERSRYLDAMVDGHKYCSDGRAAVFGEPDLVYALVRLCCENGIIPVVAATGAVCPALHDRVKPEIESLAATGFVSETAVCHDCDFDIIETLVECTGTNLLVGSSDGRRIAHKFDLDLIRCGFPIHDRVGGQRIQILDYEGSLRLLDEMANALLGRKERNFRRDIHAQYFPDDDTCQG